MADVPNGSAIDGAVERTKKYEPQEVAAFVNGILGSFVRNEVSGDTEAEPAAIPTDSSEEEA